MKFHNAGVFGQILTFFVAIGLPVAASGDVIPDAELEQFIQTSQWILVLKILKAEVLRKENQDCGILYKGMVERDLRHDFGQDTFEFIGPADYGLRTMGRYVVFLSIWERDRNKENFFRNENLQGYKECAGKAQDWYFNSLMMQRRIFELDQAFAQALNGQDVMVVRGGVGAREGVFMLPNQIPDSLRDYVGTREAYSRFIKLHTIERLLLQ